MRRQEAGVLNSSELESLEGQGTEAHPSLSPPRLCFGWQASEAQMVQLTQKAMKDL